MYLNDIFTVPVNLAGLPGISIPAGLDKKGYPLGLQIIGKPFDEQGILNIAYSMEEKINFSTVDVKISDELKEYLKSGVEAPYSIKGNGSIWLQTKGKYSIEE